MSRQASAGWDAVEAWRPGPGTQWGRSGTQSFGVLSVGANGPMSAAVPRSVDDLNMPLGDEDAERVALVPGFADNGVLDLILGQRMHRHLEQPADLLHVHRGPEPMLLWFFRPPAQWRE